MIAAPILVGLRGAVRVVPGGHAGRRTAGRSMQCTATSPAVKQADAIVAIDSRTPPPYHSGSTGGRIGAEPSMRDLEPDDEFEDREYPDPDDEDDDDGTMPCPHCRRPIYEDAERCPRLRPIPLARGRPAAAPTCWFVIGLLLALFVALRWIFWF